MTKPTDAQGEDELRTKMHMAMLEKSKNAKDCGDLTVVPLGFAVTVALAELSKQREQSQQGLLDVVVKAINGNRVDREATRDHMESKGATEQQIFNMEIEADDTDDTIDTIIESVLKAAKRLNLTKGGE